MNQVASMNHSYKLKRVDSLECTCEINKMRNVGRRNLRYSMCDICSEKEFTQNVQSYDDNYYKK